MSDKSEQDRIVGALDVITRPTGISTVLMVREVGHKGIQLSPQHQSGEQC